MRPGVVWVQMEGGQGCGMVCSLLFKKSVLFHLCQSCVLCPLDISSLGRGWSSSSMDVWGSGRVYYPAAGPRGRGALPNAVCHGAASEAITLLGQSKATLQHKITTCSVISSGFQLLIQTACPGTESRLMSKSACW